MVETCCLLLGDSVQDLNLGGAAWTLPEHLLSRTENYQLSQHGLSFSCQKSDLWADILPDNLILSATSCLFLENIYWHHQAPLIQLAYVLIVYQEIWLHLSHLLMSYLKLDCFELQSILLPPKLLHLILLPMSPNLQVYIPPGIMIHPHEASNCKHNVRYQLRNICLPRLNDVPAALQILQVLDRFCPKVCIVCPWQKFNVWIKLCHTYLAPADCCGSWNWSSMQIFGSPFISILWHACTILMILHFLMTEHGEQACSLC